MTNPERAVLDGISRDFEHKNAATLKTDHAVQIKRVSSTTFTGDAIAVLARHLPSTPSRKGVIIMVDSSVRFERDDGY